MRRARGGRSRPIAIGIGGLVLVGLVGIAAGKGMVSRLLQPPERADLDQPVPRPPKGPPPQGSREHLFALLAEGRFADLEGVAEEWHRTRALDEIGDWRLREFYCALEAPAGPRSARTDASWSDHLGRLATWVEQRPGSAVARAAYGSALAFRSWGLRGSELTLAPPAAAAEEIAALLARARSVLEAGLALPHSDPGLRAALQSVATGQGWTREEYERLYTDAVAAEPTYWLHYQRKAWHLHPQLRGKPGEWEQYARAASSASDPDRPGALYARIVGWAALERGKRLFEDDVIDWLELRRGFEELEAALGPSSVFANLHSWAAWRFQDKAAARAADKARQGRILPELWSEADREEYGNWQKRPDHDADIRARLARLPLSIDTEGTPPIYMALVFLSEAAHVTVVLDGKLRRLPGVPDPFLAPVSGKWRNVPVGRMLLEILGPAALSYRIQWGSVFVSTKDRLRALRAEQSWCAVSPTDPEWRRALLEKIGKKRFTLTYEAAPVEAVIAFVAKTCDVNIRLEGLDPQRPVDLRTEGRPTTDAISIIAWLIDAEPAIEPDGIVLRPRAEGPGK